MPAKKITQDPAENLQAGAAPEVIVEVTAKSISGLTSCGHVNRQSVNVDGEVEDVLCTLPVGHVGDHSAEISVLRENPYLQKNPNAEYKWREGKEYEVKKEKVFWGNAASVPAHMIKPDYEGMTRDEWVISRRQKRETPA